MLWRHLCLARAVSAAGLIACSILGTARAESESRDAADRSAVITETVPVLEAQRSGDLDLQVRGNGADKVRFIIRNTSAKRLNVVLPPGLVAASSVGQGAGGAGGGGFQSMGLGAVSNRTGGFGQFRGSPGETGFRSVPVADEFRDEIVTVPAGKTVEFNVPGVCLNYGVPTPTPRNKFTLVDVDDYSRDTRVRKALRSLATMGTSHGVAQATMWNVCNSLPFDLMIAQAGQIVNVHEVALAARFVDALDASGDSEKIDPAYLTESRVFLRVQGEGNLSQDADRIVRELDHTRLLGLPTSLTSTEEMPLASGPALFVSVVLTASKNGETRGRIVVNHARRGESWTHLGKTYFVEGSGIDVLDGPSMIKAIDRALASAFVTTKVAKRGPNSTGLRVDNHLPFTVTNVWIKPAGSLGSVAVPYRGMGIGPARTAQATIQASGGTVERVELNGL